MTSFKKRLIATALFASFTTISFGTMHFMQLFEVSKWLGVGIGGGTIVAAMIILIILRKHGFIFPIIFTVNSIASGLATSSMFVALGGYPPIWQSVLLVLCLTALFTLFALFTMTDIFDSHHVIYTLIFFAVLITAEILGVIYLSNLTFALSLIWLIPFIGFTISIATTPNNATEYFRYATYSSFAIVYIIIIVVLFILSEGEILEGLDFGPIGGSTNRKPKRKK